MQYIVIALMVAGFTALFLVIYKFVINPQMIVTPTATSLGTCPDRWSFNVTTKMCEPNYKTQCMPFNPDMSTLNTYAAKCNVARSCGTTWGGFCG
jgi:hypothetical protein